MKKCTRCKVEKDFSEFGKNKGGKFGLKGRCNVCLKEWRDENADRINSERRGRYANDPELRERVMLQGKKSYRLHSEKRKSEKRKYTKNNKDKISKLKREYYLKNRESLIEKSRIHYRENLNVYKINSLIYRESRRIELAERGVEYRLEIRNKYIENLKSKLSVIDCECDPMTLYVFKVCGAWKIGITSQSFKERYRMPTINKIESGYLFHMDEFHVKSIEKIILHETKEYLFDGKTPFLEGTGVTEMRTIDLIDSVQNFIEENKIIHIKEKI